jgi:UrcA family protein
MRTGTSMSWLPLAIALAVACAAPSPAGAADAPTAQRVFAADLDLRSTAGLAALYGRLQGAARVVCGFDDARGYAERRQARRCVTATLDAVIAAVAPGTPVSGALRAEHRAARHRMPVAEPIVTLVESRAANGGD